MRRVGEEAAQPVLRRLALGERLLEPVEHRVERHPEAADLGPRVGRLDTVGEVAAGDRAGRVAHAVERQQADAHDRPRHRAEQHQDDGDDQRLHEQQAVQTLLDVAERHRDDRGQPAARIALGEHAVRTVVALLAVHGEDPVERNVLWQVRNGSDVQPVVEDARPEDVPVTVAHLPVRAGRQPAARAAAALRRLAPLVALRKAADALVRERAADRRRRRARLVGDPIELERALLEVGDRPEEQQPERRDREQRGQQAGAQRGHHVRGGRSA
jgi:hypothetical protein